MGKITDEQRKIIDSFSCERLTSRRENEELIKHFSSRRGSGLVDYLQRTAWEEDLEGKTANYLIKDADGDIVLFFSLKCGALFNPLNEKEIEDGARRAQLLWQVIQGIDKEGEEKEIAIKLIESIRSGRDIPAEHIKKIIKTDANEQQERLEILIREKEQEPNEQIIRVDHTYSAIDLVNFCANDETKEKWKAYGIEHTMGEVMFWAYITPIILEIQKYVGCQFVFLFAADMSEDGTLINYYNVGLKFEQPKNMGANKPYYDFCCQFMCQEICNLKKNRISYFDNFNPDTGDVIA